MIVKYRKAFFDDVAKVENLKYIEGIEFITDTAHVAKNITEIPGLKWLRQYDGIARIEVAPFRIGVEIIGNTIIFKRVIHRDIFYTQFS